MRLFFSCMHLKMEWCWVQWKSIKFTLTVSDLTPVVVLNFKTSKVWPLIFLDLVISSREPVRRNQTGWRSSEYFFTVCSTKYCAFCQDQGPGIPGGNHIFLGTSVPAVYRQRKTKWGTFNFYVVQLQRVDNFLLWQRNISQSVSHLLFSTWIKDCFSSNSNYLITDEKYLLSFLTAGSNVQWCQGNCSAAEKEDATGWNYSWDSEFYR